MKATESQRNYANAIADVLNISLPRKNDINVYREFISKNKPKYDKAIGKTHLDFNIKKLKGRNLTVSDKALESFSLLENKPGVYFFWRGKEILYIGKSKNLGNRILSSLSERQPKKNKISHFSCYITPTMADCNILEPYLISVHKPKLNTEFITDDMPTMFTCDFNLFDLDKHPLFIKGGN